MRHTRNRRLAKRLAPLTKLRRGAWIWADPRVVGLKSQLRGAAMLSNLGSVALLIIGLVTVFLGWMTVMQFRVEPEHTTKASARGGWVWIIAGLALMGWRVFRFF